MIILDSIEESDSESFYDVIISLKQEYIIFPLESKSIKHDLVINQRSKKIFYENQKSKKCESLSQELQQCVIGNYH